jgi:glycerophosphoryl diester phosphodiesterase
MSAVHELLSRPFAHRGLHDRTVPENSLAGFEAAVARGFGVELDIRLSADGVPMVFHDASLGRLCGVNRAVSDLSAAELSHMHLLDTRERIPTLAAAVRIVGGRAPILVDVKSGVGQRRRSADAIAILLRCYAGPVGVVGFDPWLLAGLRNNAPGVPLGQSAGVAPHIVRRWWARHACRPVDELWSLRVSRADFVTFNIERLPSVAVARARERVPVVAWTVRSPAAYLLARRHTDGVIVEDAAVAVAEAELQANTALPTT